MTGARERRCTLRAPAPRTLARPHVRMSNVPLGCVSDRRRHIRGDVHLHTKVRRLSQWAQCTHFQRVHALLHVHTRSGCGIPGSGARALAIAQELSWSPQIEKKKGKTRHCLQYWYYKRECFFRPTGRNSRPSHMLAAPASFAAHARGAERVVSVSKTRP